MIDSEYFDGTVAVVILCTSCFKMAKHVLPRIHAKRLAIYLPDKSVQASDGLIGSELSPETKRFEQELYSAHKALPDLDFNYFSTSFLEYPIEFLVLYDSFAIFVDTSRKATRQLFSEYPCIGEIIFLGTASNLNMELYDQRGIAIRDIAQIQYNRKILGRILINKLKRMRYTRALQGVYLDNDWGSSGLWTRGANIPYDYIDLPLSLLKKIHAWQRRYDDTLHIVWDGREISAEWNENHWREAKSLAKELEEALPQGTNVAPSYAMALEPCENEEGKFLLDFK